MLNGCGTATSTATTTTPTTTTTTTTTQPTPITYQTVSPSLAEEAAQPKQQLTIDNELSPQDIVNLEDLLLQVNTTNNAVVSPSQSMDHSQQQHQLDGVYTEEGEDEYLKNATVGNEHNVHDSIAEKRAQQEMNEFNALTSQADAVYSLKSDAIFPDQINGMNDRRLSIIKRVGAPQYYKRATYTYNRNKLNNQPVDVIYLKTTAIADNANFNHTFQPPYLYQPIKPVFNEFKMKPKVEGKKCFVPNSQNFCSPNLNKMYCVETPVSHSKICCPKPVNTCARHCDIACCPDNTSVECKCVCKSVCETQDRCRRPRRSKCSACKNVVCCSNEPSVYRLTNCEDLSGCHTNNRADQLKAMFRRDINPLEHGCSKRVNAYMPVDGENCNRSIRRQHGLDMCNIYFTRRAHCNPSRRTKRQRHKSKSANNANQAECVTSSRSFRQTVCTPPPKTLSDKVKGVLHSLKRAIVPNMNQCPDVCPPSNSGREICEQPECATTTYTVRRRHCSRGSSESSVSSCGATNSLPRCRHVRRARKPSSNCESHTAKRHRKR